MTDRAAQVSERLRAGRGELEQAVMARVRSIADPTGADPTYVDGLRRAAGVALDYAQAAIEGRAPALPGELLAQARLAARNGVSLDTVLRRYVAGFELLNDLIGKTWEAEGPPDPLEATRMLRTQIAEFDRLLAAVAAEYRREAERCSGSPQRRKAERVKRLLAGELQDASEIPYDFVGWHLGVVATGPGATQALRRCAAQLDRRLLLVAPDERTIWAWLGGTAPLDREELAAPLGAGDGAQFTLGLGEPSRDLVGWRLTHRQGAAAAAVAARCGESLLRYGDVALLCAVLGDELLATSLRRLYLEPLGPREGDGKAARETLRAYLAAGHNVSSAAAGLGINRRTVANRLREVEERVGRGVTEIAAELDVALRMERLESAQTEVSNSHVGRAAGDPH